MSAQPVAPRNNNLWTAPPRPAVDRAEAEHLRAEISNDPALVEAACNYKPSVETLSEIAKYESRLPSHEILWMVLP